MDFHDTPDEAAFRAEVRDFIAREGPKRDESGGDVFAAGMGSANRAWLKKLAARKWIAPAWPVEYGGAGMSVMEQFIFNYELAEARVPRPFGIAVGFIGPTLIVHGTEEQKQKYLPEILGAEVTWCQGYSEPGSGSDLASLQTRASRDGDDYVINGQKIWTTGAQHAKWIMMLARTDPNAPKHKGISYFIADMKSPGITIQPLTNAAGTAEFNQIFFEDVRVPRENMIGQENQGWYLAQTTISFERSSIGAAVSARQSVEDLVAFGKEHVADHLSTLAYNQGARYELLERHVEAGVSQLMSFKIISLQAKEGVAAGHEAAVAKLFNTELNQRIYRTGMKLVGLYGQLDRKTAGPVPPMKGRLKYMYLRTIANTIEGGTSEIQRNVIAQRGLGLPRD
jgi:alkylation response protein AidB-like acyl-CoA dehydrogenase